MIYITNCTRCYRNWKADTALVGHVADGHIGLCPYCCHAMIFVGAGFRDLIKTELANPENQDAFESVRKDQETLAHERGLFG